MTNHKGETKPRQVCIQISCYQYINRETFAGGMHFT